MKAKKFKNPSIFLATSLILDTCIKIWRFFFIFGRILGIENLNNHLILALLILLPLFWIYIAQLFFFLGETIFALWRQKKSEFFGEKNNVHSKKIAKLLKLQNWKGFRKKKNPPRYIARKKKEKKRKRHASPPPRTAPARAPLQFKIEFHAFVFGSDLQSSHSLQPLWSICFHLLGFLTL